MLSRGTKKTSKPSFVASHDSATALVMALADFLHGREFEGVGAVPSNEAYAALINAIPISWRRKLYSWSGKVPAIPQEEVGEIDASEIDRWICDLYPDRKYPAIAIGSCNGAAVHLCAAMGIPWLPQTVLIPVDKGQEFPVDEPKETMEWGRAPAEEFLKNNPDWQMHHMMDPNQDRLRVGSVGYFRVKKNSLGKFYRKFLKERLEPGGKIIVIDCGFSWPVHKINDRHFFQLGGLGGLAPEEYYHGSEKVSDFLRGTGSDVEQWDAPEPTAEVPEAEWGMTSSLAGEVASFCTQRGIPNFSISFDHPQDLSAPVADLYRWWYGQQKVSEDRLLVETFNLLSPYLCLQKRCVPYWLAFIVEDSAEDLQAFLDRSKTFQEIYMMVLSHGKDSAGRTPLSRWEDLMNRAAFGQGFIGTDPQEYPVDMAVYARYSKDLKKKIGGEHSIPSPLDVQKALHVLQQYSGKRVRVDLTSSTLS